MPRPKVKDEERKRVAKACDTCKRRKEKCDGGHPCLLCRRRSKESECTYTLPRQRRGGHAQRDSVSTKSTSLQLGEALASSNDAEIAIESLLTLSGSRSAPKTPAGEGAVDGGHAPVPKLARLLRDGHGKFIFVGDSSNLAFLQNIRRLARVAIGESKLTTDPLRHAMVEAIPTAKTSTPAETASVVKPTRTEAQELLHYYLLITSGVIDLFDKHDIVQHLRTWIEDATLENSSTDAIFYLVLAIGAKSRPSSSDDVAEMYFNKGRALARRSFMDDPSVLTVQSYILISFYLLTACRRNGAFMLLGIAIRAAYALGLHRSDISGLFEARERKTREKVWKSLRVLDLFMCASLGRPPATSEVDGGNVAWESKARGYEDIRMGTLHSSAMLRICFIFERILSEVYCRREVDVQLVNSISAQYRDWNLALDTGLDIDGLAEGETVASMELQQMIGMAHLKGAYYWSIILLTRPFLIFEVSSKFSSEENNPAVSPKTSSDTSTLSEACIDAALRSIEVASDVIHASGCPRRPVLVMNSVFVSALVIGLAMFGDYDKSFPLSSSLDQARQVLSILAKHDPSARRYFTIISYLQQAAREHIRRRDQRQLQKRQQEIHNIFGDMLRPESSQPEKSLDNVAPLEDLSVASSVIANQDLTWTQRLDETSNKRGPILTTSGVLASSGRDDQIIDGDPTAIPVTPSTMDPLLFSDVELGSLEPYTEEFPLFSLMNDVADNEGFFDFV